MANKIIKPTKTQTVEKKEVPLTLEQRVDLLTRDCQELGRGINVQARLLTAVVKAFDYVLKEYYVLTRPVDTNVAVEKPSEEKKEETPKA